MYKCRGLRESLISTLSFINNQRSQNLLPCHVFSYFELPGSEAVALERNSHGSNIVEDLLDASVVKSHCDPIHHLKLLNIVIPPILLQQILMEQSIYEGVHNW